MNWLTFQHVQVKFATDIDFLFKIEAMRLIDALENFEKKSPRWLLELFETIAFWKYVIFYDLKDKT